MNNIFKWSGVVALVILAIMGISLLTSGGQSATFGTACTDITCIDEGLRVTNGPLEVATSNTATSTTAVGCIQTTATSTATPVKLVIGAANSAASSTFASGSVGFVGYAYGNCP